MLAGVQQYPSFSLQTCFDYKTFYLVQCFSTVFWQSPYFRNAQRHAARLYIFSFSGAFLAFGPFWKCTEACGPVIFFLVFLSIFLHLLASNRFWHFVHFPNAQRHVVRSYFFSFHARPQKSYLSKFHKCCPTKIK